MTEAPLLSGLDKQAEILDRYVSLNPTQRKLVILKVSHPDWSFQKIARELGMNRIFVGRQLQTEAARTIIDAINEIVLTEAKDLLISSSAAAAETLIQLMHGQDAEGHIDFTITPDVRLRAAVKVLEFLKGYSGQRDEEGEEVVYEMVVDAVGNIKQQQKKLGAGEQDDTLHELDVLIDEAGK